MPIKPENKSRYPKNWKQIRQQILERANDCCEFCGIANHTYKDVNVIDRHGGYVDKRVYVVLTIAHLDHNPENCDPSNLRALCQKCHLTYDARHHAETARRTRDEKANKDQLSIF